MRSPGTRIFFVLLAVSAAGFFAGGFEPAHARKAGPRHAAPATSEDCKKDAECIAVPDDCCPCSQGGALRALPRKQKDTYEKDRKKRCAGTMCAEVVSQDPSCAQRPFCGAGICELGDLPAGSAGGGAK